MKASFLFIICAWCVSTASYGANWYKLHENDRSTLWIDKQSIIEQTPYKKAWAKVEYKALQRNPDSVDKEYNASKALWYFDCTLQKSATTQVFQYLNQELVYSVGLDIKNAELIEPLPDSDVERAMRYVCKPKPTPKPVPVNPAPSTKPENITQSPEQEKATSRNQADTPVPSKDEKAPPPSAGSPPEEKVENVTPSNEEEGKKKDATPVIEPKSNKSGRNKSSTAWSYTGKTGPKYWGKLDSQYSICDTGMNQSPVNIDKTIHAALKPIRAIHKFPAKDIQDTGTTLQINFQEGNIIVLDKTLFKLRQMVFHSPSENTLNGKHFPLEVQFMYNDNNGLSAIQSVMFKEGEPNEALEQILQQVSPESGQASPLKSRLLPSMLMPTKQNYYRFNGSLTTPPCTEGVKWIVMKSPLQASLSQLEAIKKRMPPDNNRPTQSLNGRIVLE